MALWVRRPGRRSSYANAIEQVPRDHDARVAIQRNGVLKSIPWKPHLRVIAGVTSGKSRVSFVDYQRWRDKALTACAAVDSGSTLH